MENNIALVIGNNYKYNGETVKLLAINVLRREETVKGWFTDKKKMLIFSSVIIQLVINEDDTEFMVYNARREPYDKFVASAMEK